ncbi:hypothetical protein ACQ4LE_007155 [Meloidogyne hapla]
MALLIIIGMFQLENSKGVLAQGFDDNDEFWPEVSFRKKRKANNNNGKGKGKKNEESATLRYKDYYAY